MDNVWKGKSLTDEKPQRTASLIPQKDKGLPFFSFSFRYCTQQDFFGYAEQDAAWFANLQERLKDLCGKTAAILENHVERDAYRLHPINWKAKNCPIKIDDLSSVPKKIKDNIEDDFFWQFQLSKGTGRVVGFFNEDTSIFYIVLLDPKHNIQPSKDYGYQVDKTEIALTEYERIQLRLAEAENIRNKCKARTVCPLSDLRSEYLRSDVFYASIDIELKKKYHELVEKGTFQELFENFLMNEYLNS
jgi:hypothetical protein